MPSLNQKGLVHIALVILLLLGIVSGVYLVQKSGYQIFKPKAAEDKEFETLAYKREDLDILLSVGSDLGAKPYDVSSSDEVWKPVDKVVVEPLPESPFDLAADVPILSGLDQNVQQTMSSFRKEFILSTIFDGNELSLTVPFAEYDGGVFYRYQGTGRISPFQAKKILEEARNNGRLEELMKKNFQEFEAEEGEHPNTDRNRVLIEKYGPDKAFLWNIQDLQTRAFYESLRELGIFIDCSGMVYQFQKNVYDSLKSPGSFDAYIRDTLFPGYDVSKVIYYMSADRWFDSRISDSLQIPSVSDIRPGDFIGLTDGKKIVHVMQVSGWSQKSDRNIVLEVDQSTDEHSDQGVSKYEVLVTNKTMNLPLHKQKWINKLGQESRISSQTTLGHNLAGAAFVNRLAHLDENGNEVITYKVARPRYLNTLPIKNIPAPISEYPMCGATCTYSQEGSCFAGNCLDGTKNCSLNVNCGYVNGCSSGVQVACPRTN